MRTFSRKPRKSPHDEASARRRAGDLQPEPLEDTLAESLNQRPAVVSQLQIQRALNLDKPGDPREREAESVAGEVVRKISDGGPVAPAIEESIRQQEGGGERLTAPVRKPMEHEFGADFKDVTVHADAQADQISRALNARAFTTGRDIFFKEGEYQPESRDGQELIAHELTHVVQQSGGTKTVNRARNKKTKLDQSEEKTELDQPEKKRKLDQPEEKTKLGVLPDEVVSEIAGFMEPESSLLNFMQTSKKNYGLGKPFRMDVLYKELAQGGIESPAIKKLSKGQISHLATYIFSRPWSNYGKVLEMINGALDFYNKSPIDAEKDFDVIKKCVNDLNGGCVDLNESATSLDQLNQVLQGSKKIPDESSIRTWAFDWLTNPGMDNDEEGTSLEENPFLTDLY